jgi:glycosyltransferase involved in cell wall biosynthesis
MDTNKPLVSVIMTSYNREDYLASAIESVLASTYTHWELLIVDDGSKDNTVNIARHYAQRDERVKVHVNVKNLGDYPNRNHAASLAKGKYLKYVDADDYIYSHGLEILVEHMERFPEAGWGLCSLEPDKIKPFPFVLQPSEIFHYHHFTSSLFHKAPLSAIFRKDVFDEIGGFSGKRQMSDTEMWHLLALKSPMVLMPQGIVWYRTHDAQESAQIRADLLVRIRYTVSKLHFYEQVQSIPLSEENRKKVILNLRRELYKYLMIHFLKFRWKDCITILNAWKDHTYDFKNLNV